jgi:3'-phosphoadenosine 5'-phosphosulfate sulfotransferase
LASFLQVALGKDVRKVRFLETYDKADDIRSSPFPGPANLGTLTPLT